MVAMQRYRLIICDIADALAKLRNLAKYMIIQSITIQELV